MCVVCGSKTHRSVEHRNVSEPFNPEKFMNAPASRDVPKRNPHHLNAPDSNQSRTSEDFDHFALWETELANDSGDTSPTPQGHRSTGETPNVPEVYDTISIEGTHEETLNNINAPAKKESKVRKVTASVANSGKKASATAAKKASHMPKKFAYRMWRSLLSLMRRHKVITAIVFLMLLVIVFDGAAFTQSIVNLSVPFIALAIFFYGIKRFVFNRR